MAEMALFYFVGGILLGAVIILAFIHYIPEGYHIGEIEAPHWSNRPRPDTFFVNSRGHKIYYEVRGDVSSPKCKGVLFVNVGYSAHTMRPSKNVFFESLSKPQEEGLFWCVATFDFSGAGYSEGIRTLVEPNGMLDDLEKFVDMVMTNAPDSLRWFCVGQSMAGALVLLFSHRIFSRNFSHYAAFGGCVAIAPLVTVDKPPPLVFAILSIISKYFPHCMVPSIVSSDIADEEVWNSKELVAWHKTHDVWGSPGGLGWGKPMRWGSATALIAMSDSVVKIANNGQVTFPLLVIHDPEDKVTQFSGSMLLMEKATSAKKALIKVDGGKHDLMSNEPLRLAKEIHKWLDTLNL